MKQLNPTVAIDAGSPTLARDVLAAQMKGRGQ